MNQKFDPQAGMTVTVKGIELQGQNMKNSKTIFNIVGQTNGKTIYGVHHSGNSQGWNDQFVVNYRDLQYDDLDLVAFENDQQIGRGHLNIIQVMRSPNPQSDMRIQLRNNANHVVGYLPVQIHRYAKQQIVGGLKSPIVSLKTQPFERHIDPPYPYNPNITPINNHVGIQKIQVQKLNLFSCMDGDQPWQFMPYNFSTKTRQMYSSKSNHAHRPISTQNNQGIFQMTDSINVPGPRGQNSFESNRMY